MNNLLRQLAASFENQILYARMKDGMPVEFFENKKDFTSLQIFFIYWLEVYHSLYMSISKDNPYLNKAVINNEIRCDAYLKHRNKLLNEAKERNEPRTNIRPNNKKNQKRVPIPGLPTVVYREKS